MKSPFLALCLALGFSIAFMPAARADDMAKAMDMVCQTAKPWRAVQGKSHDASALNLLSAMTQGVRIAPELVDEWARRWDRTYNGERLDAISWCEVQLTSVEAQHAWEYWAQQMMKLEDGDLRYLDRDSGVDPDDMRRWAYLWRFYGPGEASQTIHWYHWYFDTSQPPAPKETTTWGQLKALYR